MQDYFKWFFLFAFLGTDIFLSDEKVNAKSNRNRNCIFIPLGMPRVARWIFSFMLHIFVITCPTKLIPISMCYLKNVLGLSLIVSSTWKNIRPLDCIVYCLTSLQFSMVPHIEPSSIEVFDTTVIY